MKKTSVFVSRAIPDLGLDLLRQAGFEVEVWPHTRPMSPAELVEAAGRHPALLCVLADRIDAAFLQACAHLDIISQFAAGYDNIDIPEATRLGILIGNTPNAVSQATADLAFGLLLAVARKMFFLHNTIARGEWGSFQPKAHLGIELHKKTLGIFGLGGIGLEMAKRCKGAYDMDILYCNRHPNPVAESLLGARKVSFETLLRESDILSVHCVLSDETQGIFNKMAFGQMKPSAIFINTSRGLVHNETDLIDALRSGQLWGAGLDVTNPEPMRPDNPLLSMETVAVLPHVGSGTVEARNEMARLAAENIIGWYQHGEVPHRVTM